MIDFDNVQRKLEDIVHNIRKKRNFDSLKADVNKYIPCPDEPDELFPVKNSFGDTILTVVAEAVSLGYMKAKEIDWFETTLYNHKFIYEFFSLVPIKLHHELALSLKTEISKERIGRFIHMPMYYLLGDGSNTLICEAEKTATPEDVDIIVADINNELREKAMRLSMSGDSAKESCNELNEQDKRIDGLLRIIKKHEETIKSLREKEAERVSLEQENEALKSKIDDLESRQPQVEEVAPLHHLSRAQIIYLVHKAGLVGRDDTAVAWANVLHLLTGMSRQNLRSEFKMNDKYVTSKSGNKLPDKTKEVDDLLNKL